MFLSKAKNILSLLLTLRKISFDLPFKNIMTVNDASRAITIDTLILSVTYDRN
jgi:hypothetical protein